MLAAIPNAGLGLAMASSGSFDRRSISRVLLLSGVDYVVHDSIVEGDHIGTVVRRGSALVSTYPAAPEGRSCNRCQDGSVVLCCGRNFEWELLCAEHGY